MLVIVPLATARLAKDVFLEFWRIIGYSLLTAITPQLNHVLLLQRVNSISMDAIYGRR